MSSLTRADSILGCLIGTAVGDAGGLCRENLSPRRAELLWGPLVRPVFLAGCGFVSDDTDQTCLVGQSLLAAGDDVDKFGREFARRLAWWLAELPPGIGLATLRSCLGLWCGCSPETSGVFSAGNGAAMRSAILGAVIDNLSLLKRFVHASTRVTHIDPKAEYGALAVALAARRETDLAGESYLAVLREHLPDDADAATLLTRCEQAVASVARGELTRAFAASLGLEYGVTGYVYDTVPACLHACLRHPEDFEAALVEIVGCGGDADTTGAIVGGILGARLGVDAIRPDWIEATCSWPRSREFMSILAAGLAEWPATATPIESSLFAAIARNGVVMTGVMLHLLRRLLPPY